MVVTSMKLQNCALALVFVLGTAVSGATVVNDGTTTEGLVRRAPEPLFPPATTTLEVSGEGVLQASVDQRAFPSFPTLHTAWFSDVYAVTGSTHQVSASFRLAESLPAGSGGGVLGCFDEAAGLGMTLALKNAAVPYVGVEVYQLDTGARPREWLYSLDGTEVHPDFSEAWRVDVAPSFRATNFVMLRLSFGAPLAEDLEVLPNATARIAAEALQDNGQGPQSVAPRLEFLTTLPEPASGEKRFGYYAVYADPNPHTGSVGELDDLIVEGDFGVGNRRPIISLWQPAPGTIFAPGSLVELVAEASDPDAGDQVVRVDFFVGETLIGSANAAPFSSTWSSEVVGIFELTAVATDTRGASRVSDGVQVEIAEILTDPPTLMVRREDDRIVVSWDRSGVQLQASLDLGTSWFDVPTSGTQYSEVISDRVKLFRVVGSGIPAGPELSVTAANGSLSVTWAQAGFQLQRSTNPVTGWTTVVTDGNQHVEPITATGMFFRLSR